MQSEKDKYITYIALKKEEIREMRLLYGKKKTMREWYLEAGADVLLNGTLYSTNGIPIESFRSDGKTLSTSDWCTYGFGVRYDGNFGFGEAADTWRDFTSAFPMLVKDGNINIFPRVAPEISARNPRSVFAETKDGVILATIDGRQKEMPGMTVDEAAEYMQKIGAIHAANLDGGGSTRMLVFGETVNSPCEDRAVSNVVAVWLGEEKRKMKIYLDAGHNYSKYDTGAEGNGLREQDITFYITKKVGTILEKAGYDILYAREELTSNVGENYSSSLHTRADKANSWGADIFLSIHCNSFGTDIPSGTEVYVYSKESEVKPLAKRIGEEIAAMLNLKNRGVGIRPDLSVLRRTEMPALLVETAFLSNAQDAEKLKTRQDDFAEAIAMSVIGMYGGKEETKEKPQVTELTSVNDIVWELAARGVITDKQLWLQKLEDDKNAYWLARKCVNYIRTLA